MSNSLKEKVSNQEFQLKKFSRAEAEVTTYKTFFCLPEFSGFRLINTFITMYSYYYC